MSIKKNLLLSIVFVFFGSFAKSKRPFTIVLNPAGDAQYTGRVIDGTFERGITLQFVEYLQRTLEHHSSSIRVVITRTPRESLDRLEKASFANRLKADLYISIHFFQKKDHLPTCNLYYFCKNKLTDSWQTSQPKLNFLPYNCSHLKHFPFTKSLAKKSAEFMQEKYSNVFETHNPLGIPFAPLLGVQSPALAFEVSLNHKNEWKTLVTPFVATIEHMITLYKKESLYV